MILYPGIGKSWSGAVGMADGEIADTGEPAVTVRPISLNTDFNFCQLVQTAASWLASEVYFRFSL